MQVVLFSLLTFLFSLVGCKDPFNLEDTGISPPAGKGSFSLTLSSAGRTVLPDTPALSDFAVYNLAFAPTSNGTAANVDRTNATLTEPVFLEPGTYSLTVNAYKDSAKNLLLARGTLNNITITAGQNTSAAVTLEALLSGGTGTFKWNITLPAGVTATMKITPIDAGGTAEQTVTLSNTAGSATLNSGQYRLTFVLNKTDGRMVIWKELLHIYQNLESFFPFTFTDAHLSDSGYTVTYNYGYNGQTSEQSVLHGGKLPPNHPSRDGYAFRGWYTDDTFTNVYDFDQPVIDSFALYAQWEERVDGSPIITTASLPNGLRGTAYSQTLTATGDTPITWSIDSGALPAGLTLSGATISGTLTTSGTSHFTVKAANNKGYDTRVLSITVMLSGASMDEAILLTENVWADGNIATSGDQQWFVFTATAATQYIHAAFGTIISGTNGGINVQVYQSNGTTTVGSATRLYSSTTSTSQSLTNGQTYYIRVRPYSSSYSGTYQIGFTASTTPPNRVQLPSNAIPLTVNIWADGNLPTSSDVQRFVFTATASTQYIHAAFGTLTRLNVNVYDSGGAEVEGETSLSGVTTNISRTLTSGQTYYIMVRPGSRSYSGTYRIAFNASSIPPGITPIHLTANQWADSNLSSYGQQWFTFTATATTQYIHFEPGTLIQVGVRVYDSSGTQVGNATNLSDTTTRISRTLTSGQTYYIRIMAYTSGNSGTYRIGFTASTTAPIDAIPLTVNVWADGNIPTSSDVQWFVFTATASTQYIHAAFGTIVSGTNGGINVQVYQSNGTTTVGSATRLYSSTTSTSRSLTNGQTYYIRVIPYSSSYSGSYRIGFTASTTPPNIIQLPTNAIPLTENQWADGNLPSSNAEQWFVFTATASTQYIHAAFGTLTDLLVQVYNSSGAVQGSETWLTGSTSRTSRTLTSEQTYYIRVKPYGTYSGTYRIGFNASTTAPPVQLPSNAITLTLNQWADGNLPTSSSQQWFVFTATASTQYIHAAFGTLTDLYVQVYDSSGTVVGSETNLWASTTSTSRTLTSGQTYYIRVRPYSSTDSGTYRIAFNTSFLSPDVTPISLTANQWADGNIPTSSDVQWFVFTATASTQYIHFSTSGTLSNVYVQVYTSSGATVGSETNLYGSGTNTRTSLSLTAGQTYYIRVRPSHSGTGGISGTYQIVFNATPYPPNTTFIPLTFNTWADGNIPTSRVQWFVFTATATTQYIHVSFGTLNSYDSGIYVQVYDSGGAGVGSETFLYGSTTNISRSLTSGQTYYIRVWSYDRGTYRIGFNATPYPPGTTFTTLTANQWADGNLPTSSSQQWFVFTATASTQYIHTTIGWLLDGIYVHLYDSSGAGGGGTRLTDSTTSTYESSLTTGDTYYIMVRQNSSRYSGTYWIGFTASTTPPNRVQLPFDAISLSENQWANGNIPTSSDPQWFSFTATATTQYIHFSYGTLPNLYVQVYDSGGAEVGSEGLYMSIYNRYTSRSLTPGETYYIRVRPPSGGSGSYQIGFNTSFLSPDVTPISLTANQWADGNILTSSGQQWQWFSFTATTSTQYLHVAFGSLTDLYVQVYDSSSATVGSETRLYNTTRYTSRSLTTGQTYYIGVWPSDVNGRGTYRIGFNTSTNAP